ncbi:MAG: opacity protein-like surface antigen [Candidatus Krumholzibacteriia bacterium]|jgi:opacity protein-like surface antigen
MSQGIHPRIRSAVLTIILGGVLLCPVLAGAGTTPAGQWVGEIKTPEGDNVEISLALNITGGIWSGTLNDPTLGETVVSNLKVSDTRISFTFKPAAAPFPLNFFGSYIAADDRVTGTFSLHGNSRFVKFERVPGTDVDNQGAAKEPAEPVRIRHDYKFAVTGRIGYWAALRVIQDEIPTINDVTSGDLAIDGAVKWFLLDGFNIFARYYRGGQGITDNPDKLAAFADINLNADSYLKLDGFEFGIMGYLGNIMMPESKFNPYITTAIGQTSWELTEGGRGTTVLENDLEQFKGDDISVAVGIGTEYELSSSFALEFEWLWRYFLTEDEKRWSDTETLWSNTHVWGLSAGVTYGF